MTVERVRLVRVSAPDTEAELVAIVETLEAFGVPCFVSNPSAGSPVGQGRARKLRNIMVSQERLSAALEIIGMLQRSPAAHADPACNPWSGRLRALVTLMWRPWSVLVARHSQPTSSRATASETAGDCYSDL
jgi:hypothetical protein